MSILERNFDLLPQRADPRDRALRQGGTWFSKATMREARHYADLTWARVGVPAAISLGVLATGFLMGDGNTAAALRLVGGLASLITLRGVISKATLGPRSSH